MTIARAGEHKAIDAAPAWLPAQRQPGRAVVPAPVPTPPRPPVPPPPRPPLGPPVTGLPFKPVGRGGDAPPRPPGPPRTQRPALPVLTAPKPERRNWKGIAAVAALVVALVGLVVFSAFASRGISGATLKPHDPPAVSVPDGGSGGLLPPADGVQAAEDGVARETRAAIAPVSAPQSTLAHVTTIVTASLAVPLAAISAITLWGMLSAWHTPASGRGGSFSRRTVSRPRIFTLMLPARFAGRALDTTIAALASQDHDSYEVLVIVGHDDPQTLAVAQACARRFPTRVRVITDHSATKDRPTVLNAALQHCLGELIAVFRVGEEIRPGMLRAFEARFEASGASVVQAGLRPVDFQPRWWALRDGVERWFRYGSRLQAHADRRFVPLDGPLVVTRAAVLRGFSGWSAGRDRAGCELGVQLTSVGCQVAVAHDPVVAAREVVPDSVARLIEQRSTRCRAELQQLRDGLWMALPGRGQRLLARCQPYLPFLQAAALLLVPLLLAATIVVGAPLGIVLLSLIPLVPAVVGTAVEAVGLRDFGRACGIEIGFRHHVALVLGAIPYQAVLVMSALRAIGKGRPRGAARGVAFR